ncbi:MAG TPA: hypothetical protein VGR93_10930 [Candidatus Acidoferrales bacterium]|nr:hypothetical protein [Candidatus Acidoferrales bacterium]
MQIEKLKVDTDGARELLRHTLATLAYRAAKALRNAPAGFENFAVCETSRTPGQILAHLADLMDWAVSIARGKQEWRDSPSIAWELGVSRFFAALQSLDQFFASDQPLSVPCAALFQGAIADAFTHVGQIAMMRRIAGSPVRGENYFRAEIVIGRVGPEQSAPHREFD